MEIVQQPVTSGGSQWFWNTKPNRRGGEVWRAGEGHVKEGSVSEGDFDKVVDERRGAHRVFKYQW